MKKIELKKMSMPSKKVEEKEAEMDMDMLGEDLGMSEDMDMEAAGMSEMADLEMIADEDLIAEVKKRGLSLEDMPETEAEEEEMEMPELEEDELA
jgi:hypothetical protein